MSLMKSFAKETVVYGLGSIMPKLINFVFASVFLTRVVSLSDFGIHGILYSYVSLILVIITFRMETSFFRFGSKAENRQQAFSNTTWIVWALSAIAFVIACFFSKSIASVLTSVEDSRYVIWFALIALFDALAALPFAKLRLENRPKAFTAIKIFNALFTVLFIIFFLLVIPRFYGTFDILGPYIGKSFTKLDYVFLANVLASGIMLLLLLKEYRFLKFSIDLGFLKTTLKYASPLVLVGIAATINNTADRYLIKELNDPTGIDLDVSGLYNGCVKLAIFMTLFTTAFNYAAEPFFFKNHENKNSTTIYGKVTLAYTIVAGAVFLFIAMYLDILKMLIASSYHEGVHIVPILTFAYLFLGLYYNFAIWYKLTDKTIVGAYIGILGAAITIGFNILLIPMISYEGAAWTSLICYVTMAGLAYWTGKKQYPIEYPITKMIGYLAACIVLYIIFLVIQQYINSVIVHYSIATFMLLGYLIVAYKREKTSLLSH